ncbi:hypothetical protein ABD05_34225 [Burkholderia pyrrocinia]|nr:hypothetical protein ABD05_34225 [Burkholderia pyrrocinia]
MHDADQSTFDVGATVPAATLRCTMPSRDAAFAAASMIPMNAIAPSPSCAGAGAGAGAAPTVEAGFDASRRQPSNGTSS